MISFPEACTKRCNEYSIFKPGLVTNRRRQGDEHTVRGLAGVYQCRMNIIVVSSNHHHSKEIPPPNTPSLGEIWLIFLNFKLKATDTTSPPPRFHQVLLESQLDNLQ
jgi:hypothetical protein